MLIIYDDTFSLRSSDYAVAFISEPKYKCIVTIVEHLTDSQVEHQANKIGPANVIACHKTIKFKNSKASEYLSPEENSKVFEKFEKTIRKAGVIYISFSGQIPATHIFGDDYVVMNKRDFYSNLKDFLDVYITEDQYVPKVLKFGKNYRGNELLSIQNNVGYICSQHPTLKTLSELRKHDKRTIDELNKYNLTAKIRVSDSDWFDLLNNNYHDIQELLRLLHKITKSFMKYGKCIYHI